LIDAWPPFRLMKQEAKGHSMIQEQRVHDFLDEDFLKKLETLKLLAGRGTRGSSRGEHPAWKTGPSLEFQDYRTYQPGDDFRYVDWNVYGRLDRLFLKLFRADEERTIHILLDMSRSMDYGTPAKAKYAKKIAAALAYVGLANLDRVGITSFSHALGTSVPPLRGKNHYLPLLRYLLSVRPGGQTDFNASCQQYASTCRRAGVAIVISDLLDPKGFEEGLHALRCRKFDVCLIQVLDHGERYPPLDGYVRLRDMETGETRSVALDDHLLGLYRKRLRQFLDQAEEFCSGNGIHYFLPDTTVPFEDFVLDYLRRGTLFH
jgi:uncharacterized protein (DUF58 family)